MYSVFPMPKTDWKEENMQYAFCFFPLIGIVIGAVLAGWLFLCKWLSIGIILQSVGCVVIPILCTGGIHLDGFCDTMDALCSRAEKERKLEILKDSHIGAFAAMALGIYFLISFAVWSEYQFTIRSALLIGIGYVLSRSLSGLAAICFLSARKSGMLKAFSDATLKRPVFLALIGIAGLCVITMVWLSVVEAAVMILVTVVWTLLYRRMAYRQFGGVTGDLAGYFLVCMEFLLLCAVVCVQHWR